MTRRAPRPPPQDNVKAIQDAWAVLSKHVLFGGLLFCSLDARGAAQFAKDGFARIVVHPRPSWMRARSGPPMGYTFTLAANAWRRVPAEEWVNVIAQAELHVAMCHVDPARSDLAWRLACELVAADFLRQIGVGRRPAEIAYPDMALPARNAEAIADHIRAQGAEAVARYSGHGIAGAGQPSWVWDGSTPPFDARTRREHTDALAAAIRKSVVAAVETAGARARGPASPKRDPNSLAERARSWFIASYPLLAALAATFEIVEDTDQCAALDIRIAAVDPELQRIYINPTFGWTYGAMQFAMAHELMHVGLSHAARRQGRDPFLWNVACDYVINGWLVEMGVGELPTDDLLLDPALGLERESAEAIYDRIVKDLRLMRRLRKAITMSGRSRPDILGERPQGWWKGPGCDLDAFYRRALAEGLDLHQAQGVRGLLPGDLIEEVRALQQPPIPWDVQLGQWLDAFFPPLERRRTFARASRRQSATPDIPRPVWARPSERLATRTFGVVLDTSGSMPPNLLARGLGAIASYALSRDVTMVRVIQCDARVHDMGYVEPERLLDRVEVRGRGGTVLRPATELLERSEDFPKDAPILVITDGACDVFTVRREHAFLMPEGARLPFRTQAPTFRFERPGE
jgi:predicted metal-dependent peptidase